MFNACRFFLLTSILALLVNTHSGFAAEVESEADLIAILEADDSPKSEKAIACKKLAVHGSSECIGAVAPLLLDPELTSWARITLEAIQDDAAVEALAAASSKLDGLPLVGVLNSLGVRRSSGTVTTVADYLSSDDTQVVEAASLALGKIGGDTARDALLGNLEANDKAKASLAAEGLIRIAEVAMAEGSTGPATDLYDKIRSLDTVPRPLIVEATRGAILARGIDGVELMVETLSADDRRIREVAFMTARQLEGDGVIDRLIASRGQVPQRLQPMFIRALGGRGEAALVSEIMSILGDASSSEALKVAALDVLPEVGGGDQLVGLLSVAVASDSIVSEAALKALSKIQDEALDNQILDVVKKSEGVKQQILVQLIGTRFLDGADFLKETIRDGDGVVRELAMEAMGNVVEIDDIPFLIERATGDNSDPLTSVALKSLGTACARMPDQKACVGQLRSAIDKSDLETQVVLVETLAAMGGAEALGLLGDLAKGGSTPIQDASTRVLGGWMSTDAGPVLAEIGRIDGHPYRIRAVRGYLRLVRQFVMKQQQRHQMIDTAVELADRAAELELVLDATKRYPTHHNLKVAVELSKVDSVSDLAKETANEIAAKLKPSPAVTKLLESME
ncbi:MAG: PBS lyase [Planctomycetota bacterium]